jgi:uncharacterized protein (TIGR02569 family)
VTERRAETAGLSTASDDLPTHVRSAFGVRDVAPVRVRVAGMPAWVCDDVLIRPVTDTALASWSARVLDTLEVDGVRVARPLRSSDGRWVISGYRAGEYLGGREEPRYGAMVATSLRLHAATASVRRPRLLDDRDDLVARADAAAWGERTITLDPGTGGALFGELARYRRKLKLASQVVHGDLFGTVLFDGGAPPVVLDLMPFWRPVEWAAAVIVVDALAWGGAPPALVGEWSHLDEWPQALLRALLFRLALHAQHPSASTESLRGLETAAELVAERL